MKETIESTATPRPGDVLDDRYELLERLGIGGMGEVWRARHVMMDNEVALKMLHSEFGDQAMIQERFRREAQAAAAIDHPNVCKALDFGVLDDGTRYMVMEHVSGETLSDHMREHAPMPLEEWRPLTIQICEALERAHELGIVHRDLKPENIMLTQDGERLQVKVLDFGIAKLQDKNTPGTETLTRAGEVFGTPAYMSPEQASGEGIDARTDVYALGVMMYEMATGRLPFQGNSPMEQMAKRLVETPPPPRHHRPTLPRAIDALIMGALEREPEDRVPSAQEIARCLRDPSTSAPSPPTTQALEAIREMPTRKLYGLLGGVGVSILVALLLVTSLMRPSSDATPKEVERARVARAATLAEERATVEARQDVKAALASPDLKGAARALSKLSRAEPNDPHLSLLTAAAHHRAGDLQEAFNELMGTLQSRPAYADSEEAVEIIESCMVAKGKSCVSFEIVKLLQVQGQDPLRSMLAQIALGERGKKKKTRKIAYERLKKSGQLEALPPGLRGALELTRARSCADKKAALLAMTQDGIPARAHPTIEALSATKRSGCGLFWKEDCLGCLRDDLERLLPPKGLK